MFKSVFSQTCFFEIQSAPFLRIEMGSPIFHSTQQNKAEMNEEVLQILNEPDNEFDSDIDMSNIMVSDVLEEEEVEFEYTLLFLL